MGTTYNVSLVFSEPKSSTYIDGVHQKVKSSLILTDSLMSTYKASSEISKFNQINTGEELSISEPTLEVLTFAKNSFDFTDGFFDVSVGPLVDLWGFGAKSRIGKFKKPGSEALASASKLVSSNFFDIQGNRLRKISDVNVDLSAIAKGYAVDQVAIVLRSNTVSNFLVEVGGEISVQGHNSQGKRWSLGIELPDSLGRKAHSVVTLTNRSLATSGDYRNYYLDDGIKYSHTINPKTYVPVRHNLASVSVISDTCMEADALATGLMAMGEELGYQFAVKHNLVAYFIYRTKSGYEAKSTGGFDKLLN